MAKTLRLKATDVISNYLRIDEDGDMVFQSMLCPFLGSDNYCSIYEYRHKPCGNEQRVTRKKKTREEACF